MDNLAYSIHFHRNISRSGVGSTGFVRKERGRHTTWKTNTASRRSSLVFVLTFEFKTYEKYFFSTESYMIAQKKVKQEAECENVRTRKTINSCVTFKIGSSSRAFASQLRHRNRRKSLSVS